MAGTPSPASGEIVYDPFDVVALSSEKYISKQNRFEPVMVRKCAEAGLVVSYSEHGFGLFTGAHGINTKATIFTLGLQTDTILTTAEVKKLLR